MGTDVSIAIAFAAGILSFLSPCVLPLVPAYIGHLSGSAVASQSDVSGRRTTFFHAMGFVLGFSAVLITLGATAAYVGSVASDYLPLLRRIGGAVLIVMGLHVMGILRIRLLHREKRVAVGERGAPGYLRSFLVGTTFSLGWTPCVGPILGAIFTMALSSATIWKGTYLLGAYSLGLGIPFLATGLALGTVSGHLRRLNRHLRFISIISGLLLIAVGILILTNSLSKLSPYFDFFDLGQGV